MVSNMRVNPAIPITRGTQPLDFGHDSLVHRGWDEFKPKRYHPEKVVQALLLKHMPDLKDRGLKLAAFCGPSDLAEMQRFPLFNDYPFFITSSFQDDLFWQLVLDAHESWAIAIIGAPSVLPRTQQQIRYLDAIRALYPTWYRPLREFVTTSLPNLRETSLRFSPVLLQERPGRFFLPQIYEKTLKHIRKHPPMQFSEAKDQLPFFDMTNRSGWVLASLLKRKDVEKGNMKIDSALFEVSGLWREMDAFANIVKEIGGWLEARQQNIQSLKKIVIANLHQEMQGIFATYLRKYFNVALSSLEFPDLLWGAHSLATASDFLLAEEGPRLLIQGQGQDKLRLVLLTQE